MTLKFSYASVLGFLGLLATSHIATAAVLSVPAQYITIQSAITASINGDTVLISDGTYTGPGNVDLDFGGKNITVTSQNGAARTVIDCQGSVGAHHRGFNLHSGETSAVINGFKIKNGNESNFFGGGISNSCLGLTIENCIFKNNTSREGGGIYNYNIGGKFIVINCNFIKNIAVNGSGGGIYNDNGGGGKIAVSNCTFTHNSVTIGPGIGSCAGGGIYNLNFSSTGQDKIVVTDCMFDGNTALSGTYGFGGGIFNYNASTYGNGIIKLTNCILNGNSASNGGGIVNLNFFGSKLIVANCTLINNSSTNGPGGIENRNYDTSVPIMLMNDILYNNVGGEALDDSESNSQSIVTYCDVLGGYEGIGNIDADPKFVNALDDDMHLQPDSPCIGAGTASGAPIVDKDNVIRPNPPSIGAYE